MRNETPLATRMKKDLIKDDLAYVDSVPKSDLPEMEKLLQTSDSKGCLMRVFIGASESIPVRALGYVASAARVHELMPVEQVQIISVANLGSAVNGVDLETVRSQFKRFASVSRFMLRQNRPDLDDIFVFCEDTDANHQNIDDLTPVVAEVLRSDSSLRDNLSKRGSKHGGDFRAYTAAHVAYQDLPGLELRSVDGEVRNEPEQVVSIGCLQEKIFHMARNAICEKLKPTDLLPSIQVFTLHAAAPYFPANGGEQLLDDSFAIDNIEFGNGNPSTQRDMEHIRRFLERRPRDE